MPRASIQYAKQVEEDIFSSLLQLFSPILVFFFFFIYKAEKNLSSPPNKLTSLKKSEPAPSWLLNESSPISEPKATWLEWVTHNSSKKLSKPLLSRIGHFVEAQILAAIGIDYVDESEVLTLADEENHINKHNFQIPFICGCRNLGEALLLFANYSHVGRIRHKSHTCVHVEWCRHGCVVIFNKSEQHRDVQFISVYNLYIHQNLLIF